MLESTYRRTHNIEQLLGVYDRRIDNAHTDHDRLHMLRETAVICENDAQNPDRALQLWCRALRLDASDEATLEQIQRLATETGDWEAVRGQAEAAAQSEGTSPERAYALYIRAAQWYAERLDDMAASELALRQAISLLSNDAAAHRSLIALLGEQPDRASDLAASLRQWADIDPTPDSKVANLIACATLYRDRLGDDDRSASALEEVLKVDADRNDARSDLIEIRQSQGRWKDVSSLLAELAAKTGDAERRGLVHARRAEVLWRRLEQPEQGMQAYEDALQELPSDLNVRDALANLYQELGAWDKFRDLLLDKISASDSADSISTRLRLAQIYETQFEQRSESIAQLEAVRQLDPHNVEASVFLARLFEEEGAWDKLLALLDSNAEHALERKEPYTHRDALERISKIQEKEKGDLLAAIEAHQRILSIEEDATISLRELARLHQAREDWGQATDALRRLSQQVDGDEAIRIAERLTTIASSHVDDSVQKQTALEVALELDPTSERTREHLATHYESEGNHELLARLLKQDLARQEDAKHRISLIKRLATLHRDNLGDPAAAAQYLEQAVEEGADDREMLVELSEQYIAAGRTHDAIPLLRKIVEGLGRERSKEAASLHHRLGRALEGRGRGRCRA